MSEIYIDTELKLAIYFNREIKHIRDLNEIKLNSIYRGRVKKKFLNMGSAFVDIGLDKDGYLDLKDSKNNISETDEILVQIKKIPEGEKSVKLTMELSVSGKNIVYFPNENFLKFSKKIGYKDKKNMLEKYSKYKGILFRSSSINASDEELTREYNELKRIGEKILLEENLRPTPKLIYSENNILKFLRDYYKDGDTVITNDKNLSDKYKGDYNISYDKNFKIFYNVDLLKDYKRLFDKKLDLENGINIIIEKTEAMHVIDVNSSNYSGTWDKDKNILEVNKAACREIAKQIVLRNISGIIIIDFISMKGKENNKKLCDYFKFLLKEDNYSTIHGFTSLGLMEVSRKNSGMDLKNKL